MMRVKLYESNDTTDALCPMCGHPVKMGILDGNSVISLYCSSGDCEWQEDSILDYKLHPDDKTNNGAFIKKKRKDGKIEILTVQSSKMHYIKNNRRAVSLFLWLRYTEMAS